MCTSLTFKTKDNLPFLARTMDFDFILGGNPSYLPRKHKYDGPEQEQLENQFGFLGMGREFNNEWFFVDGVNEYGLSMEVLYFPGLAEYEPQPIDGKINLAPHQLISYLLGNCKSLKEVKETMKEINLIDHKVPIIDSVPPFHWILSDESGACLTIEPMEDGVHCIDNPVGVMTNSPELKWHLANLNNFISLQPDSYSDTQFGEFLAHPFGVGTGTSGLPGGYTPPQRFVRAVYLKNTIHPIPAGEDGGLNTVLHILHNVDVPKGPLRGHDNTDEFTQYMAIMSLKNRTYYFVPYGNQNVFRIQLDDKLLASDKAVVYPYPAEQQYTDLKPKK